MPKKAPKTELGKVLGFDPPDYQTPETQVKAKASGKAKKPAKAKVRAILVYPSIPTLPARILAFDPGFALCGYAVLDVSQGAVGLEECGVIQTTPKSTYPQRLATIWKDLSTLFGTYRPDLVVAERFFSNNLGHNAVAVSQARGLIVTLCGINNLPLFEPQPNVVKKQVHGNGSASKKEMQIAVSQVLGLNEIIEPDDAADAVANGLIGAWALQQKTLGFQMGEDEFNRMGSPDISIDLKLGF